MLDADDALAEKWDALTELGRELLPVIEAIVDVGTRLKRSANACSTS